MLATAAPPDEPVVEAAAAGPALAPVRHSSADTMSDKAVERAMMTPEVRECDGRSQGVPIRLVKPAVTGGGDRLDRPANKPLRRWL